MDLALLWRRLAAVAPIRPLAWELPYATGTALKKKKKKERERERERKTDKKGNTLLYIKQITYYIAQGTTLSIL